MGYEDIKFGSIILFTISIGALTGCASTKTSVQVEEKSQAVCQDKSKWQGIDIDVYRSQTGEFHYLEDAIDAFGGSIVETEAEGGVRIYDSIPTTRYIDRIINRGYIGDLKPTTERKTYNQ